MINRISVTLPNLLRQSDMLINIAVSVIVIFSILAIHHSAFAMGGFFKIRTDFSEGRIDIEPVLPVVRDDGVIYSSSSGLSLCLLGCFRSSKKEKSIGQENAYFYLVGDPDDLNIMFVSYACDGPYLLSLQHVYTDIHVLKGEFTVNLKMAMGRQVISNVLANYLTPLGEQLDGYNEFKRGETPLNKSYPAESPHDYVNYACSDEYRSRFRGSQLVQLKNQSQLKNRATSFGEVFEVSYPNDEIQIRWDAQSWVDKDEQAAQKLLQWGREKFGFE